jgi:pyrroline-5-carboxylate reductase
MKHTIGFIGGGRVTKILLQGFKNKDVKFEKVLVTDTNPEVLKNNSLKLLLLMQKVQQVRILFLLHCILQWSWIPLN